VNVLYFQKKLPRCTRTSVWLRGPLRLEESLGLLAVRRRSGLSVVGRHLGGGGEMCSHRIRFYADLVTNACGNVAIRKWGSTDRDGSGPVEFDLRFFIVDDLQRNFPGPAMRYLIADYRCQARILLAEERRSRFFAELTQVTAWRSATAIGAPLVALNPHPQFIDRTNQNPGSLPSEQIDPFHLLWVTPNVCFKLQKTEVRTIRFWGRDPSR